MIWPIIFIDSIIHYPLFGFIWIQIIWIGGIGLIRLTFQKKKFSIK